MRKLMFGLFMLAMVAQSFAQFELNWKKSSYLNTTDHVRSVAYNPITDHLLIASRNGGQNIFILDPATGDSLGACIMDTAIVKGGTYHINQVSVADDGTIYLCNLSAPQYSPGSTLKIYRWDNETASPVLLFSDELGGLRFGDSFYASGSGSEKYLYCSGMGSDQVAVLKDNNSGSLEFITYVTLPYPGGARHTISVVTAGGDFWCKGDDSSHPPALLMTVNGLVKAECPDTLIARGASGVCYVNMNTTNIVFSASAPNGSNPIVRATKYAEDELGVLNFNYCGNPSDSLLLFGSTGLNPNMNSTTALTYDYRRHSVVAVIGNNCLASLSVNEVFRASTPRIDTLYPGSVIIDGEMDFFPSDYVSQSNERKIYLTWSNSKFFAGITGPTLIGANNMNYLYVAFDTDPTPGVGNALPPSTDGGITQLPFNADVVLEIEPWNAAGPMVGKIYKASQGTWSSTDFDGETAAQGALAWSETAPLELTEIAAIRDDICLGRNLGQIGVVAYMVNRDADTLVCAFPSTNATGAVQNLNYYFQIDSLGSNMFPADTQFVKVRQGNPVGICQSQEQLKGRCSLAANFPNPFNPSTTIEFTMTQRGHAEIQVYDILGNHVSSLLDKTLAAGAHQIIFDGSTLSSGVYFYRLKIDGTVIGTQKMALLK